MDRWCRNFWFPHFPNRKNLYNGLRKPTKKVGTSQCVLPACTRKFFISRKLQRRVLRKKNVNLPSPHYNHHTPITTLPSPHYHHHTTITTLQSPHYHHHSTITSLPLLNSLLFLRLGRVSPRLARCTPLRGSRVSERSRCAFLRI